MMPWCVGGAMVSAMVLWCVGAVVPWCVGHYGMGIFTAVFWALRCHVLGIMELGPPVPCVGHHSGVFWVLQYGDLQCHVLGIVVP